MCVYGNTQTHTLIYGTSIYTQVHMFIINSTDIKDLYHTISQVRKAIILCYVSRITK